MPEAKIPEAPAPKVEKPAEKKVVKEKVVDLRPTILTELARPGLKATIFHMPGTINYRMRWMNADGREVESKFLAVYQHEGKIEIMDRTGTKRELLKTAVQTVFENKTVLPAAESD